MGWLDQVASAYFSDNINTHLAKQTGYWNHLLLCINLRYFSGFAQMDWHLLIGFCSSAHLMESASQCKTLEGRGSCPGPCWRSWLHSLATFLHWGHLQIWSSLVANAVILFPIHPVYLARNRATQKVLHSVPVKEELCIPEIPSMFYRCNG